MTEWEYLTDVAKKEDAPQWVKTLVQATAPIQGACFYDNNLDKQAALYVIQLTRRALELAEAEILEAL